MVRISNGLSRLNGAQTRTVCESPLICLPNSGGRVSVPVFPSLRETKGTGTETRPPELSQFRDGISKDSLSLKLDGDWDICVGYPALELQTSSWLGGNKTATPTANPPWLAAELKAV